ncbi:substrate-binding domain-containing protein [Amycolatopsis sp. GM8]|uniref:substrate-binding domain-containing protein n=1 Tax=Amycolatopsis sp. GM8 TaxID=2896530 RepID=UPI001F2C5F7D|nr:substrate-binding domain-containing protein [Amycolatopsis sp. GM8]
MRKVVKLAALVASAAALTTAMITPASADPPQAVAATDITAVGSDTIEFLGNNFAALYNATSPAKKFDSWNATKPTGTGPNDPAIQPLVIHDSITVKPGVSIQRSNGSSEGIADLKADTANPAKIDLARSSRKPQTGDTIGTNPLLFIPVAEDEVRYALSNAVASHGAPALTNAQLASIYKCQTTNWNQVGGSAGTIQPKIPQAGSGTRSFFESQLGITDADLGACVATVQEHDPTQIANNADAVAPFSKARSTFPTNLSTQIKLNTTGFVGFRPVYLVTRNAGNFSVPTALQPLLGDGTGVNGWVCSTAGQNEVTREGFGLLPGHTSSVCGFAEHI